MRYCMIYAGGYGQKSSIIDYSEKKNEVTLAYNTAWLIIEDEEGHLARIEHGSIWVKKIKEIKYEPLTHSLEVRLKVEL